MGKTQYTSGTRERLIERLRRQAIAMQNGHQREEGLLTTGEVAMLFRVSHRAVRCWADAGKLPYLLTMGGHRRFRSIAVWDALQDADPDASRRHEQAGSRAQGFAPSQTVRDRLAQDGVAPVAAAAIAPLPTLTRQQIAELAGVSLHTVGNWDVEGKVFPLNPGGRPLRYDQAAVEAFLRKRKTRKSSNVSESSRDGETRVINLVRPQLETELAYLALDIDPEDLGRIMVQSGVDSGRPEDATELQLKIGIASVKKWLGEREEQVAPALG